MTDTPTQTAAGLAKRLVSQVGQAYANSPTTAAAMVEAADELTRLSARVVELRGALIESGNATGGHLTEACSDEFLLLVPEEVRGRIAALTAENEKLRSAFREITDHNDKLIGLTGLVALHFQEIAHVALAREPEKEKTK